MQFTLKNVKINKALSDETLCFSATVYVDGQKAFVASNRGCGGCNEYYATTEAGRALLDKAHAYAASLPPRIYADTSVIEASFVQTFPVDLDVLVDEALTAYEVEAQIKSILRKLAFVDNGKLYTVKAEPTPANIAALYKRHPEAKVLNDMARAEAVALVKEMLQ